jgi:hypothetical protein
VRARSSSREPRPVQTQRAGRRRRAVLASPEAQTVLEACPATDNAAAAGAIAALQSVAAVVRGPCGPSTLGLSGKRRYSENARI